MSMNAHNSNDSFFDSFFGRYVQSPDVCTKAKALVLTSYPVELGLRLRELVYPVLKTFSDAFGQIEPDERMFLQEFVVRFNSPHFFFYTVLISIACHFCSRVAVL